MTDPAARERAALDLLTLLPDGWRVSASSYDPGARRWSVTARGPHPGRNRMPETMTGTGEDELAAMAYLAILLRDLRHSGTATASDRWQRAAFLEGPEEDSRRRLGRGLTHRELERVLRAYPAG